MSNNLENKEKKLSILVIEDDKFLRELLVRKLEGTGFNILIAVDGQEALKKVKEELPQLILLDLVLPSLDGYDILKQIKQDPQTSKIPVIILSNLGQEEEVKKGLDLGANDYLIKAHFTPDEIIRKVKAVLKNN
ncbi:response regulator [Patescibacteria group bacterium]|nr:response regulator [Patescibacteria group bacterium]MBU1563527.1 response regulator [Patescibacteria group bacterium]MBU2068261.1 response regulator [Patescibacteria group bacterium]